MNSNSNNFVKHGLGRGLIRNKALQDSSSTEQPNEQKVQIKQEPEAEPVASTSSQAIPDVGITAEDLLAHFNFSDSKPLPEIKVAPLLSERFLHSKVKPKNEEPDFKRTKPNIRMEEIDRQEECDYINRVKDQEMKKATNALFRTGPRQPEVKMEVDDDTESVHTGALDGVSTCLDEVNSLLDPNFRSTVEPFFRIKRSQDLDANPLPIEKKRKQIILQIRMNRVVIIKGSTGCGKTTQVPQYIMDDQFSQGKHFNIVVTQPRRIAAKSVAERVCAERGWRVGELVGYQIGMDRTASELTRLLYCTTGVLLQKLCSEKKIDQFTHIIIDEVHERTCDVDVLIMIVRKLMWNGASPVRVILMSATFDARKFADFFSVYSNENVALRPYEIKIEETVKPIIKTYINGFPREWADEARNGASESEWMHFDIDEPHISATRARMCPIMIKHFDTLDIASRKGAVLVFLPGFDDIRQMTRMLEKFASENKLLWRILPLHSTITSEEQHKVFLPSKMGERKIILSTNVAESSITVPDIVFVIDYCLTKNLVKDPVTNYPTLKLEWAAHSNCDQRAGRCGRVSEGRVFRMVTSEFYNRYMPQETVPELLRTPLENAILKIKKLDMGPPRELLSLCIDPPNLRDFRRSILRLKRVGGLSTAINGKYDREDGNLTLIGRMMADLPLDVQMSKLVMIGYLFDCLEDCTIIAACLSLQNFFSKSFDDTIRAYKARLAWSERTFSDPIAYWYAYRMFWDMVNAGIFEARSLKAKKWCKLNFIQYARLHDVINLVDELKKRLALEGINSEARPNLIRDKFEDQLILKVVLAGAFYPYYYLKAPVGYQDSRRDLADKNPLNTVKLSGLPKDEGVLYANQIKKALSEIDANMDLEFQDTHCYVTFHAKEEDVLGAAYAAQTDGIAVPRTEDTLYQDSMLRTKVFQENVVYSSVYLAIKLKRSNNPIIITRFKNPIALERLHTLESIRDTKIASANLFLSKRFIVLAYRSCEIPGPQLPDTFTKKIVIAVTEVAQNGYFYATYRDPVTQKAMRELDDAIAAAYNPQLSPYNDPKVGDVILVDWLDMSKTSRARVVRVDRERERFEVFCLDNGHVGVIEFENLDRCVRLDRSTMPIKLFTIPAFAMCCRLCEVKPSPARAMIQEARYNDLITFSQLVCNRDDVWGMVYSVVNGEVALKLFRDEDEGLSLNDKLVCDGLFVKIEESTLSKFDCDKRLHSSTKQDDDVATRPAYSLEEACTVTPIYQENEEKYLISEHLSNSYKSPFSKEKIKLKGPYTPIEVGFAGTSRQDSSLRVHVDSESVNSIFFDPDPENSNRQLLVAAAVHLQSETGQLTARNTTLMPDITGFPQLMALLFSPKAQFREDPDGYRLNGALCGLGFDEDTKVSYDPENDMELEFDCFIDNKDITDINIIRYNISDIVSNEENFAEISGHALFQKQQKIRSLVLQLLSRHRINVPLKRKYAIDYQWYDSDQISEPEERNGYTKEYLYGYHKNLPHIDFDGYKKKVANNLETMKLMVLTGMRSSISCELCPQSKFFCKSVLRDHLLTPDHIAVVKKIFEPFTWKDFEVLDEYTAIAR